MIKIKCPICGQYEFAEDFDVCPVCEWQHDRVQEDDHDYWGGANDLSVNNYKTKWESGLPAKSGSPVANKKPA